MSIITTQLQYDKFKKDKVISPKSDYSPSDETKNRISQVISDFYIGKEIHDTPRREFNDKSLVSRVSIDRAEWNSYQSNDGEWPEGDEINSWRSRAFRPTVRNRVMSMAAHMTADVLFPKIKAVNKKTGSDETVTATVMEDLQEWRSEQSDYERAFTYSIFSGLVDPLIVVYTGYHKSYKGKRDKNGNLEYVEDTETSGFTDMNVPITEFFFENAYEPNVQKQGFVIWRRMITYSQACAKYGNNKKYKDFEYVQAGKQVMQGDDGAFYNVDDQDLRGNLIEEVCYWNKHLDLQLTVLNGVMVTEPNNPNERLDKKYPFAWSGFQPIDPNGKFVFYKSLVFNVLPDARIINSLYPLIVDGTYLSVMPPIVANNGEEITSDVIIPGGITTLADKESEIKALNVTGNFLNGLNVLMNAESSLNSGSQDPMMAGIKPSGETTAYEINRLESNAATILGNFRKMIWYLVRDLGKLHVSDIVQYGTLGDIEKLNDNSSGLIKRFIMKNRRVNGRTVTRQIDLDVNIPEEMTDEELNDYEDTLLQEEVDRDDDYEIYKVNPTKFIEDINFEVVVTPEVMNRVSEEIEKGFDLAIYDRAKADPNLDQRMIVRDFLLSTNKKSKDNPDKYILKKQPMQPQGEQPQQSANMNGIGNIMAEVQQNAGGGIPKAPKSPV